MVPRLSLASAYGLFRDLKEVDAIGVSALFFCCGRSSSIELYAVGSYQKCSPWTSAYTKDKAGIQSDFGHDLLISSAYLCLVSNRLSLTDVPVKQLS